MILKFLSWLGWHGPLKRKECFHHEPSTGTSYIESNLINFGTGKMFWCSHCNKTWFA